jgi:hypothetical protein
MGPCHVEHEIVGTLGPGEVLTRAVDDVVRAEGLIAEGVLGSVRP